MKSYIGVSALDRSGIFYFNINTLNVLRFNVVRRDSKTWGDYLEFCDRQNVKPVGVAYIMAVGHANGKVHFLVDRKKMRDVKKRMANFLCHVDDMELEEE
tara:strand:- start:27 stop:326 length:300 start_codon:yes stop_codon:yes gene_type:complete